MVVSGNCSYILKLTLTAATMLTVLLGLQKIRLTAETFKYNPLFYRLPITETAVIGYHHRCETFLGRRFIKKRYRFLIDLFR